MTLSERKSGKHTPRSVSEVRLKLHLALDGLEDEFHLPSG